MSTEEDKNTASALQEQIGGNHYKNLKIQPIQLAYILGATPAFCKVAKYCTRIKDDMGGQVDKAIHCVQLEKELNEYRGLYGHFDRKYTWSWVCKFTDNKNLRCSLQSLYHGMYICAQKHLEFFKQEVISDESIL